VPLVILACAVILIGLFPAALRAFISGALPEAFPVLF
jgi:hypothetical protein